MELKFTLVFNASMDSLKNRCAFVKAPFAASLEDAVDDPAVDFAFDLGSSARVVVDDDDDDDDDEAVDLVVSPRFCASVSISYLASRSARSKQSDTSTPCRQGNQSIDRSIARVVVSPSVASSRLHDRAHRAHLASTFVRSSVARTASTSARLSSCAFIRRSPSPFVARARVDARLAPNTARRVTDAHRRVVLVARVADAATTHVDIVTVVIFLSLSSSPRAEKCRHATAAHARARRRDRARADDRARDRYPRPSRVVMSDDEPISADARAEWLRERGVVIETREDRAAAAAAREDAAVLRRAVEEREVPTRVLKFVKIPCDDDDPFEAREIVVGAEETGDALPEALRSSFSGGGVVDAEKARAEAVRSLGERGKSLTAESIMKTTEGGSTETFALVRPSEKNGWRGVYLYLDEVGMLKNLPPNRRANRLAMECGFDGVQFYGDMYIGRVQTKPEPMRSVDFELSDLDSSAPWMRAATMENVEYSKGLKELEAAMASKGGLEKINMTGDGNVAAYADGNGMPSGSGENYRWCQTEDEVEVSVDAPPGTTAKSIRVLFKPSHFIVKINDEVTCDVSNLYAPVRPDECTWTVSADEVCVTLAKVTEDASWPALVRDSP